MQTGPVQHLTGPVVAEQSTVKMIYSFSASLVSESRSRPSKNSNNTAAIHNLWQRVAARSPSRNCMTHRKVLMRNPQILA